MTLSVKLVADGGAAAFAVIDCLLIKFLACTAANAITAGIRYVAGVITVTSTTIPGLAPATRYFRTLCTVENIGVKKLKG
jgi:hypothetical protein